MVGRPPVQRIAGVRFPYEAHKHSRYINSNDNKTIIQREVSTIVYYTIYKITNKLNGHFYIGQHKTKNLDDGYMGSGKLIKTAIKKHGIENFTKEILEIFNTEEEMNEAEKRYVVLGEGSYNLCPGGLGGWGYLNSNGLNNHNKDWTIIGKKLSKQLKGRIRPDISARIKQSHADGKLKAWENFTFAGRKHSPEYVSEIKRRNSIKQSGSGNSQFGTKWITDGIINRKISKDQELPSGWKYGRIT